MMEITLAVCGAIMMRLGIDAIWFDVVSRIHMRLGISGASQVLTLTPRHGVVAAPRHWRIFQAIVPYVIISALMLARQLPFPMIATWLLALDHGMGGRRSNS
jgi:TRAP-type mannitol/chloroaromatic compound transport system permease large subunit